MSFTQKILFPLTDHVDTSKIEHKNIFESEGDRIALKLAPTIIFSDDFTGTVIDTAKWNESDTGGNISQDDQIEGKGSSAWNVDGLITDNSQALSDGVELDLQFIPNEVAQPNGMYGFCASSTLTITGQTALLYFSAGNFLAWVNGSGTDTTYNYTAGKTYNIRIVYQNPGWKYYVQSPDDATYSTEVEIHSTLTDSTGPMYAEFNFYYSVGLSYLDDVDIIAAAYPTDSPSPVAVWSSLPVDAVVDMSTIKCWMFKDDVIQAAGNTDIKFKYAVNNGSLGTSKTLTAIRAESDPTISNASNSFKVVGVYASDGAYESKSSAWLECDVVFPSGAAAGGKYDKFAKYGHRRIGA